VTERFSALLEVGRFGPEEAGPDDKYLHYHADSARIVDVQPFHELPGWDPALIYERLIPGSGDPAFDADAFFGGNLAADGRGTLTIDLTGTVPLDENLFWGLIDRLAGKVSSRSLPKLRRALARESEEYIVAFHKRLLVVAGVLGGEGVPIDAELMIDSELYRVMAIIGRGEATYRHAVDGAAVELSESEWAKGEDLLSIAETAYEARTGYRPTFLSGPDRTEEDEEELRVQLEGPYSLIESPSGKGDADLRPGPRNITAMYSRGLRPHIVGSRFLVAVDDGYRECVVIQQIDSRNENVPRHLLDAAHRAAKSLGGNLGSRVEQCQTHAGWVDSGEPLFEIRRRWTGTLTEYLERYRLPLGAGE
jgi:hypothetical protein